MYEGQQLPKPFSCYLCMTFWFVVSYGLFTTELGIIYTVGLGVASAVLSVFVDKVFILLFRVINKIN